MVKQLVFRHGKCWIFKSSSVHHRIPRQSTASKTFCRREFRVQLRPELSDLGINFEVGSQ
jgi:hypothetical protein